MHNILYIGSHFTQRFSPSALAHFKISEGQVNESISNTGMAIVIIDVCQCENDPLASASHIKSFFNDEGLVFLMLYDANAHIENKMCYREGFDEVLYRPTNESIEIALLRLILLSEKKQQYLEKLNTVENMARTAIYNSCELGVVVRLLTDLVKAAGLEDFAIKIVDALKQFELNVCVQVRLSDKCYEASSSGVVSMNEIKLLSEGVSANRVAAFGCRSMFNENHISIIIKNMPKNEEKYGRINDHLATIIHASNDLLNSMDEKLKNNSTKQDGIISSIINFKDELIDINENIFKYSNYFKQKIIHIKDRVYESSLSLDLSDNQIDKLNEAVSDLDHDNDEFEDFNIDLEISLSSLEDKIKTTLFQ